MAEHKATGMGGAYILPFQRARAHMYRSHRILMGDGGFQSEGEVYTHTADTPLRFAVACRNAFGQTLSPHPDVTHFPTRYVAQGVLFPNYKQGKPRLVAQSFNGGGGGGARARHFIPVGFPIIADEHKPGVLWVWNKMKGVEEGKPETLANLVSDTKLLDVIYTFVNYPLDMKPVHPDKSLPKTWRAKTKGLYIFRNAYQGADDIVLQVYAAELKTMGNSAPDAGGLRLMGFGHAWTHTGGGKHDSVMPNNLPVVTRKGESIVGDRGPGRVTAWHGEEDGSGSVSINLDVVYNPTKGRKVDGHDRGGVWPLELPPKGEVSGLRAVAADYSGKCGAPALFVVVDKIEGEATRNWVWPMPGTKHTDVRLESGKNTLTMYQRNASLHFTFVTPADAAVQAPGMLELVESDKRKKTRKKTGRRGGGRKEKESEAVSVDAMASSPDHFFVIMTMQRGSPPEVVVEAGEGLDAVVRVGGRRIRFDGENVLIEDTRQ